MPGHKKHHHKHHIKHSHDDFPASIGDRTNAPEFSGDHVSPASVESLPSPRHHENHPYFTTEEKFKNLTELSETLVKQVIYLENEIKKLKEELMEVRKQTEDAKRNGDLLLAEKLQFEQGIDKALVEIEGLRKYLSSLAEENAVLQADQLFNSDGKERIENALKTAQKELEESRKELNMARAAACDANTKIDGLNADISKRLCDLKAFDSRNTSLKVLIDEKDSVLQQLKISIQALEQESYVLALDLEKAVEDGGVAVSNAEDMHTKESDLREENSRLFTASRDSLNNLNVLLNLKGNVDAKIADSVNTLAELHKNLDASKSMLEKNVKALQSEQEVNAEAEKEIYATIVESTSVRNEINKVRASVSVLRADACERKNQIAVLENHMAVIKAEKVALEESKLTLELEAKQVIRLSSERIKSEMAELSLLQEKALLLEAEISQKTADSKSSLTKICHLGTDLTSVKSHLKKEAESFSYTFSFAAISLSTLALTTLFTYFRSRKSF